MTQSSSDTDGELYLFTREHQSSILEHIRREMGPDGNVMDSVDGMAESLLVPEGLSQPLTTSQHHAQGGPPAAADVREPELVTPAVPPTLPASSLGSAPAVNRWPGQHAFHVTVYQRGGAPAGRQPPYAYSAYTGKLYTDMMAAVPFRFGYTSVRNPSELQIRAQPVYLEAQHVQTPVRRCPHHRDAADPSNVGNTQMNHVLRTQHTHFRYEEHGERCSVVVPLEPLQPATEHYEVPYLFSCMNTCTGGMNRRRLLVLFTLEERSSGRVLGRQALEVKICRCPHRDFRADERRLSAGDVKPCKKRARVSTSSPPPPPASPRGKFIIEADDEEMHRILMGVRSDLRRYRRYKNPQQPQPAADEPYP